MSDRFSCWSLFLWRINIGLIELKSEKGRFSLSLLVNLERKFSVSVLIFIEDISKKFVWYEKRSTNGVTNVDLFWRRRRDSNPRAREG